MWHRPPACVFRERAAVRRKHRSGDLCHKSGWPLHRTAGIGAFVGLRAKLTQHMALSLTRPLENQLANHAHYLRMHANRAGTYHSQAQLGAKRARFSVEIVKDLHVI